MKNIIRCIIEICLSVLIILISYPLFITKDVKAYEKTIASFKTNNTEVYIDNGFNYLYQLSKKDDISEENTVYINNYRNKRDNFKLILKLDNISEELADDLYILKNNDLIKLKDILLEKEEGSYYYLISDIKLQAYEKNSYNIRLLINDDNYLEASEGFDYSFIKQAV